MIKSIREHKIYFLCLIALIVVCPFKQLLSNGPFTFFIYNPNFDPCTEFNARTNSPFNRYDVPFNKINKSSQNCFSELKQLLEDKIKTLEIKKNLSEWVIIYRTEDIQCIDLKTVFYKNDFNVSALSSGFPIYIVPQDEVPLPVFLDEDSKPRVLKVRFLEEFSSIGKKIDADTTKKYFFQKLEHVDMYEKHKDAPLICLWYLVASQHQLIPFYFYQQEEQPAVDSYHERPQNTNASNVSKSPVIKLSALAASPNLEMKSKEFSLTPALIGLGMCGLIIGGYVVIKKRYLKKTDSRSMISDEELFHIANDLFKAECEQTPESFEKYKQEVLSKYSVHDQERIRKTLEEAQES